MSENSQKLQIENWVLQVLKVCGISEPPRHLVIHYSDMIEKGVLNFETAKQELIYITQFNKLQKTVNPAASFERPAPTSVSQSQPIPTHNTLSREPDLGPAPSGMDTKQFSQHEGETLQNAADRILKEENEKKKATLQKGATYQTRDEQLREYVDQLVFVYLAGFSFLSSFSKVSQIYRKKRTPFRFEFSSEQFDNQPGFILLSYCLLSRSYC